MAKAGNECDDNNCNTTWGKYAQLYEDNMHVISTSPAYEPMIQLIKQFKEK